MPTRSVLVRITGTPFSLNDLRPDTRLATIAARLRAAGHETTILDFATRTTFESLYPEHLRDQAATSARAHGGRHTASFDLEDGASTPIQLPKPLADHQTEVWEAIGEKIAARRDFDFVLLSMAKPKDVTATAAVVKRVRAMMPRMTIAACGSVFDADPDLISKALKWYDAVCLGTDATWLAGLAENLGSPKALRSIPNVAYLDGARFVVTPPDRSDHGTEAASPSFDLDVYPSLALNEKIHLFDLDETVAVAGPEGTSATYLKPPETLLKEIQTLTISRAFHLRGCLPQSDHTAIIARALLSRNIRIQYSREANISAMDPATISAMSASGLTGVDVRIDTGSQRLLDTHYEHPFCVTDVEEAMRRSKISSLFTAMRFRYPIPEDDHHTRAETLRIIERCNPHSALIELPRSAHESAHRGLLFQEFRPFANRARKRAEEENRVLRSEVQELGVPLDIPARVAFLAALSDFHGREVEFVDTMRRDLLHGDVGTIAARIERINEKAAAPAKTFQLKPFSPMQDAVAN